MQLGATGVDHAVDDSRANDYSTNDNSEAAVACAAYAPGDNDTTDHTVCDSARATTPNDSSWKDIAALAHTAARGSG